VSKTVNPSIRWRPLRRQLHQVGEQRAINLGELVGCQRLVSTTEGPGRRYDIDFGPDGTTSVLSASDVSPMPISVLRSGPQVVGA